MILEVAVLDVIAGRSAEFEAAFARAQHIIAGMDGYVSHELKSCLEVENRYLLLVRWEARWLTRESSGRRPSPKVETGFPDRYQRPGRLPDSC